MRAPVIAVVTSIPLVALGQPTATPPPIAETQDGVAVHFDVAVDMPAPDATLAPPSMVAAAPTAPAQPPWELAVRIGATQAEENFRTFENYARPAPSATGPVVELAIERRVRPSISVGAFGAVSRIRDRIGEYSYEKMETSTWFVDVGARGRAHVDPLFLGLVLGIEEVRNRYNFTNTSAATERSWNRGLLTGIEIGYMAAARRGIRPELTLGATRTTIGMDDEIYPEQSVSATITSVRATLGLRF
jgi:hypothetical protein